MKKDVIIIGSLLFVVIILGVFAAYIIPRLTPKETKMPPSTKEISLPKPPEKEVTKPPTLPSTDRTTETVITEEKQQDLEFQLIGSGVLQKFKSALILNTLTKEERMYQEGNFLDSQNYGRMTLYNITPTEVTLHQYYPDGSVVKEHILKLNPKSTVQNQPDKKDDYRISRSFKPGEKKVEPIKEDTINIQSPEDLDKIISNTSINDVLGLIRGLPDALVESVINTLPQNYLQQRLEESSLKEAIKDETFKNYKPAEIVNILRNVAEDNTPRGNKMLLFSAEVNSDNSPVSPTSIFTPDTKRIYACFKNEGPLAKLDRVIIKWTNVTTRKIVYWSAFMINPNAEYNFIFLKIGGRWELGKYLISIYKEIQDINSVAYGECEIK